MTAPLTPGAAAKADAADRAAILRALAKVQGNVGKAALALGVARRTLDKRIVALGLRAKVTELYPRAGRQPQRAKGGQGARLGRKVKP